MIETPDEFKDFEGLEDLKELKDLKDLGSNHKYSNGTAKEIRTPYTEILRTVTWGKSTWVYKPEPMEPKDQISPQKRKRDREERRQASEKSLKEYIKLTDSGYKDRGAVSMSMDYLTNNPNYQAY